MVKSLPVFVIDGPNWTCEVKLNEMNAEFSHEEQAFEAATKAVEAYKGIIVNETFGLKDTSSEPPYMTLALHVYLKDSDPDKTGVYVPSHIALANGGFYKDSYIVFEQFVKHLQEVQKREEEAQIKKQLDTEEQVSFEELHGKKAKKPRKPSKPRKKKGDEGETL